MFFSLFLANVIVSIYKLPEGFSLMHFKTYNNTGKLHPLCITLHTVLYYKVGLAPVSVFILRSPKCSSRQQTLQTDLGIWDLHMTDYSYQMVQNPIS